MKRTRKLLSTIIITSSLIFSSNISAAPNLNPENEYQWKTIKGTISEIAEITQRNNINEAPYPLELTNSSERQNTMSTLDSYVNKERIKRDLPTIKKIIEKDPTQFSGHYYDEDKGTVVVQITKDSEILKKLVKDSIQNQDKVEFEVRKFSWADIENAKETITREVEPGTVRALIPDVKNNKLIVATDEGALTAKKAISSLPIQSDMLEFTTLSASAFTKDTDDTPNGFEFPMGSKIGGNYANGYYNICTAGYFGENQSNQKVLVTAGHCQPVGTVNAWYQPALPYYTIGDFTFRTTSAGDGSNATSDAGYITLNSTYSGRPRVPYPSFSNMAMVTGVYLSDTPGDTVYLRGAMSGTTTSGKIAYSNVTIYYGIKGYGYNNHEVLAQGYTGIQGDSGGPVLTNYAYNNSLTGYTFDLAGTHSGRVTLDSTVSTIPPGSYDVYEPIWSTYNDLNLSGITLISK
jgi:hypothetical protein